MTNKYKSFINGSPPKPYYDTRELKKNSYTLRARCNKNNLDCQKLIDDEKKNGSNIKTTALDSSISTDYKNMIDIWVKKQ